MNRHQSKFQSLMNQGLYSEAKALAERISARNPERNAMLGLALFFLKEFEKSCEYFALVRRTKTSDDPIYNLAEAAACVKTSRFKRAKRKILQLPTDRLDKQNRYKAELILAICNYHTGEFEEAKLMFEALASTQPHNQELLTWIIRCLDAQNNHRSANQLIEEWLLQNGGNNQLIDWGLRFLFDRGEVARIEALLLQPQVTLTEHQIESFKARIDFARQRYQQFIKSFHTLPSSLTNNLVMLSLYGDSLIRVERYFDALEHHVEVFRQYLNPHSLVQITKLLVRQEFKHKCASYVGEILKIINPQSDRETLDLKHDLIPAFGVFISTFSQWQFYDQIKSLLQHSHFPYESACFTGMQLFDDPTWQLANAKHISRAKFAVARKKLTLNVCEKIRVGIFSADFYNFPGMYLMIGMLESINRDQFEIHLIAYGIDRSDTMTERLKKASFKFHAAHDLDDDELQDLSLALDLDIAIHRNGFTQNGRTRPFCLGLAPVQIAYLGYPGTLGCEGIDYLIADPTVITSSTRYAYFERIIYLPDSYQPNDNQRVISSKITRRDEHCLPETAFVFCCFNNPSKITPDVFTIWLRLLKNVEGSVLWLLETNEPNKQTFFNLFSEAGVDIDRLIFAQRMPVSEHLERHSHADLFLDTFYYNAHTTASDALWSGLPILTMEGQQFSARVAASLLMACGLPELITKNPSDYEKTAENLAKSPESIAKIKRTLKMQGRKSALFDTQRYTKYFERALVAAINCHKSNDMNDIIIEPSTEIRNMVLQNVKGQCDHESTPCPQDQTNADCVNYPTLNYVCTLAEQYLSVGRDDISITLLTHHAAKHPASYDIQLLLGKIHFSHKNYSESAVAFKKAIALDPAEIEPRIQLAKILINDNEFEVALTLIRKRVGDKYIEEARLLRFLCQALDSKNLIATEELVTQSTQLSMENQILLARKSLRENRSLSRGIICNILRKPILNEKDQFIFLTLLFEHKLEVQANRLFEFFLTTQKNHGHKFALLRYRAIFTNEGFSPNAVNELRFLAVEFKSYDIVIWQIAEAFFENGWIQAAADLTKNRSIISSERKIDFAYKLRLQTCFWSEELFEPTCIDHVGLFAPGITLLLRDDPSLFAEIARRYIAKNFAGLTPKITPTKSIQKRRIRLGYFSADFCSHATLILIKEMLRLHDREKFDLVFVSFTPNLDVGIFEYFQSPTDVIIDAYGKSTDEIVNISRSLQIDIAIDLKGLTKDHRLGVFHQRVAPIQVNFLGYPATLGARFFDYLIADRTVIPDESQSAYSEEILYLSRTYQPTDNKRFIPPKQVNRADYNLPESSFIFCCFNGIQKLTPSTFDIWLQILTQVDDSVLWMLKSNDIAEENLKTYAAKAGVEANRIIFAPRLNMEEHLTRLRCADLFLDTFFYNAHTTASDAIWSGLPILTLQGEQFAARVCSSILRAADLPELIAYDANQYVATALALAANPDRLNAIKEKLLVTRHSMPLFNTEAYVSEIEALYQWVSEKHLK